MDLKNLRTFIYVAELGSFTKAAKQLGYSQSTVSFQIKQLEDELKVHLFERIHHTVMLTPMGAEMLKYAQQINHLSDEMTKASFIDAKIKGHVRVATAQSLCAEILGENYVGFHKEYPGITLKIRSAGTEEMFRLLNHNEADMVLTLDSHIYMSEYVIAAEEKIETHFVAGRDYDLSHEGDLSFEELVKEPFLLTEKGMSYRRVLDEMLAARSLKIDPILEIDNPQYICQLLSQNLGISLLPDYVTEEWIAQGRLRIIPVKDFDLNIWKQLLYHRDKWISPAVQLGINYLIANSFK